MRSFVETMKDIANITYTDNGAKAYRSSEGGAILDLFARIGSLRSASADEIISAWQVARAEDKELADNLVLYARNIRDGGCGERRTGRILLRKLAEIDPSKVSRNFDTIVNCGRWDDLFTFVGTSIESDMWQYIKTQLLKDVEGMKQNAPISLLAKWMPSISTSSKDTKALARKACNVLGLTPRTYRKSLSALRRYLDIVERRISAREWDKINFEAVPALAMNRYIKQFNAHCREAFQAYKGAVVRGEAKVNAATLYPYDIILNYWNNGRHLDEISEEQWKALPNYIKEENEVLVIADTSGSMTCDGCRPISTAVGLAIYFAQRNQGAYHNLFMNFSENTSICRLKDGWTLSECIRYVHSREWGWSTNLESAFRQIYSIAVSTRDVPKALIIISDMQINSWGSEKEQNSITEKWQKEFEKIGLVAPKVIYWNVASPHATYLAKASDKVSFVSGYGIAPFKHLTSLIEKNAYEAMIEILSKPAFQWK